MGVVGVEFPQFEILTFLQVIETAPVWLHLKVEISECRQVVFHSRASISSNRCQLCR